MKFKTAVIAIVLFSVSAAFADEALPGPPAKLVKSDVRIYIDEKADTAKLVISREVLDSLNGDGTVGSVAVPGASRMQAMFAGLLLSASFVVGGIWLSRRKNGKAAAAVIGICAAGSVIALANAAPPVFQKIDSAIFSDQMKVERFAQGEIMVEVSDQGFDDGIRLIVPAKKDGKKKSR